MTNYARIARNDEEIFSDEDTFVSERRDALMAERRRLIEYVRDALDDALSDDGDNYFATKLAQFFLGVEEADSIRSDATASVHKELLASAGLYLAIKPIIAERLVRDAETDAQALWDNRQIGAPE